MNRRGFFLASAAISVASTTRIGQTALAAVEPLQLIPYHPPSPDLLALLQSMEETKETLAANILNRAFDPYSPDRWLSGAWADPALIGRSGDVMRSPDVRWTA